MTDCQSVQDSLDAYQQEALNPARQASVTEHLAGCEICQRVLQADQQMNSAIADVADKHWTAPEGLWHRIQQSTGQESAADSKQGLKRLDSRQWAIAAMLLLTVGLTSVLLFPGQRTAEEQAVAGALVNEFHTFVISRRDLDFYESEPETLRSWFGKKVDFRVPMPQLTGGLDLVGGRLCSLFDQRLVSFMYLDDDAWISLYIMKSQAVEGHNSSLEKLVKGYGYIEWVHEGLRYSLVGDIPFQALQRFAEQIQGAQLVAADQNAPPMAKQNQPYSTNRMQS